MSQRFFEDANHANLYAKFRPNAPPQLAQRIIEFLREKYNGPLELCCDVGCGNGQCSRLFASSFRKVLATDISPAQVEAAKTLDHPENVVFQVSPAEKSPAENGSAQLVVACVAAHWFDLPAFFTEVDRILCNNGVVAIASFFLPKIVYPENADGVNVALEKFFYESLGPYWGSGTSHLVNEYQDILPPYSETVRDVIWTEEYPYTLADLSSYLETWSGYQSFCRAKGEADGKKLLQEFVTTCKQSLGITGEPETVLLKLKRKYFLVMGRKKCDLK